MDNYQKKIKKYQTKMSQTNNATKKKLYDMKIKQYNSFLGNMFGGAGKADLNTEIENMKEYLDETKPESIQAILNEANEALGKIQNNYTQKSVNDALALIKANALKAQQKYTEKITELNAKIEELEKAVAAATSSSADEKDKTIADLTKSLEEKEELYKKLLESHENLEKELEETKKQLEKAKEDLAASGSSTEDLTEQLELLKQLRAKLAVLSNKINDLKDNIKPGSDIEKDEAAKKEIDEINKILGEFGGATESKATE